MRHFTKLAPYGFAILFFLHFAFSILMQLWDPSGKYMVPIIVVLATCCISIAVVVYSFRVAMQRNGLSWQALVANRKARRRN